MPSAFSLEIADTVFTFDVYPRRFRPWILDRCQGFLTQKPSDIVVQVVRMRHEGEAVAARVHRSGKRMTLAYRHYAAPLDLLRLMVSARLRIDGGFLLHACGVLSCTPPYRTLPKRIGKCAPTGRSSAPCRIGSAGASRWDGCAAFCGARIFFGPSGSGKTTTARLAGRRAILSDETIAVVPASPGGYEVFATPFAGALQRTTRNGGGVLRELFLLKKDRDFAHRRLTVCQSYRALVASAFFLSKDAACTQQQLGHIARLAQRIPCYELSFKPTRTLWRYLDECF